MLAQRVAAQSARDQAAVPKASDSTPPAQALSEEVSGTEDASCKPCDHQSANAPPPPSMQPSAASNASAANGMKNSAHSKATDRGGSAVVGPTAAAGAAANRGRKGKHKRINAKYANQVRTLSVPAPSPFSKAF